MKKLLSTSTRPSSGARRTSAALAMLAMLAMPAITALLAGAVPAAAQQAPGRTVWTRPGSTLPAPDVPVRDGAIALTLEQAVEIALERNLQIQVERYNRTTAAVGIYSALGVYDLLARADAEATDQQGPGARQFTSTSETSQQVNLFATQRLPTGAALDVGLTNNRTESDLNVGGTPVVYSPNVFFALTQPLLRNFGRETTERDILLARNTSRVSSEEFERQTTLMLQQVINAYWNLVGAREQLKVAEESLALARDLHQRNRIQVEVGTLAPLDLVQSEANIATREEEIIRAQANLGDAADELRRLLNLPPGELWDLPVQAVTDPETERVTVDEEEALATAFRERPELRTQQLSVERARIESTFFRNQRKPQLNLELSYNAVGAGGTYSDAFSQVRGIDFPTWVGALRFAVPVQNRAARAQEAIADLDAERARTELEQLEVVIRTEVRRAVRGVNTAAQQIEAAKASRRFQERNLDAERKRYENGMSTTFQITQIQEDLTLARSREVAAIVGYRTALAELYRATGRLLDQEGVTLADEEPAVDRFTFSPGIQDYVRREQQERPEQQGQPQPSSGQ